MVDLVCSRGYVKQCEKFWSAEERQDFEAWIVENYEAGDVIPKTKGLRKVRAPVAGRGKRGGARVIYYVLSSPHQVLLLAAHTKSDTEAFSDAFLQKLRKLIPDD